MVSRPMCLRCLSRSLTALEQPSLRSSPFASKALFSTGPPQAAAAAIKKKVSGKAVVPVKRGGGLRLKKTKRVASGRPPAPGERKAIRKRIVLSNTNALEVAGLQRFTKDSAQSFRLEQLRGRVLAFDDPTIDTLRALQAFKTSQSWHLFRRASTLVRKDTVTLARVVEQVEASRADGKPSSTRMVLFGERNGGKSVLQLQTICMAKLKGWIVVHLPEGQDLTIGTTAYQPAVDTSGKKVYAQPHFTAKLLENMLNANETILSTLRLSQKPNLPISVPDNISIARLLQLASQDPNISWPVWQLVLKELTSPSQEGVGLQRPPVLLSLDGLPHIMKASEYLDADTNSIHAHELGLVSSYLKYLSGKEALHNGGIVLACSSASNRPATPTLDFVIAERYAESQDKAKPVWNPYSERDNSVDAALQGVQVHKVGGLTKEEAKGAMEYYALSGVLRDRITDNLVAEKWTVSGGGIMGELEKSCVKQKF